MCVKVKIETRWPNGRLLWPQLIRVVYWMGCDGLGYSVASIKEVRELDPSDLNSWERSTCYALVEFNVPEGKTFDLSALQDPENPAGVMVTLAE